MQSLGEKDRKLYAQHPACFCNISEPYDKKNHAAKMHSNNAQKQK